MSTGELARASRESVLEAAGSSPEGSDSTEQTEPAQEQGWLSKLTNMMGGATSGFTSVLPPRMAITPPRAVVVDDKGQWLIALSRGRLLRLQRPSDAPGTQQPWTLSADLTLEGEASRRGVIAVSGDVLLVSRAEEPLQLVDATSLRPIQELELPSSLVSVSVMELPSSLVSVSVKGLGTDTRFALLTSDGRCQIVRRSGETAGEFELCKPLATKEVESIHFQPASDSLYLVHHIDQVDVLDAQSLSVRKQIRPSLAKWRLVDRYVITPLRLLIPQTGELGETIAAMVSGKSAMSFDDGSEEEELVRYDIVRPVFSCAAFIAVMLVISCVYFSTRDF
jgi:hypothetical protein